MKKMNYNPGEVIYSPFNENRKVFIVKNGYVLAVTEQDDGKRRIHLIYGPEAYFPIITTFNDSPQRATYEALTKTNLEVYSIDEFNRRINFDPDFCKLILHKTVNQLAMFADRIIDLQTTKLEDRLISSLRIISKDHGIKTKYGIKLPYKLKQHHLADMLGVERESITRAVTRLKNKNVLTVDKDGNYTICDFGDQSHRSKLNR